MIGVNNPLNVRYVPTNHWLGQYGHTRGFCDFRRMDYCYRTVAYLIMRSYRKRGIVTISGIISRYAPNTENDTARYIEFVCSHWHKTDDYEISSVTDVAALIYYMSIFEDGKAPYSPAFIAHLINRTFNLKFARIS